MSSMHRSIGPFRFLTDFSERKIMWPELIENDVQTVEAREDYHNRSMDAIKAGTHFLQTSFPNVAQLPKFAYSVLGSSNATYTNYTVECTCFHCPCCIVRSPDRTADLTLLLKVPLRPEKGDMRVGCFLLLW